MARRQAAECGDRCTVRALIQIPLRSGQGPRVSVGFRCFWSLSLGSRLACPPSRPYFRVCVLVAVFLSTDTCLSEPRSAHSIAVATGRTCHGALSTGRLIDGLPCDFSEAGSWSCRLVPVFVPSFSVAFVGLPVKIIMCILVAGSCAQTHPCGLRQ